MDRKAARKLQRQRLIDARHALADRSSIEAALQRRLWEWLQRSDVHALGFYFPIHGEPDLRTTVAQWLAAGAHRTASLPVISGELLEFHAWTADAPMQAGEYGISIPARGHIAQPDCLLIPCVGFDAQRYRLGFGGGYYDRTLAALKPRPLVVGIAFEVSRIESIDPRPHDVRLDVVITETTVL